MSQAAGAEVVSLTVHGPVGVVDLLVPVDASSADVAGEYSRQVRLPHPPTLYTRLGAAIEPRSTLSEAGITSGTVLVAVLPGAGASGWQEAGRPGAWVAGPRRNPGPGLSAGPLSALWLSLAAAGALLAGWYAAQLDSADPLRDVTVALLVAAAVLGVLPIGALAPQRVMTAPAFAFAAAFVVAWSPAPERLPTVLGVAALAAALAATIGRSLSQDGDEGLRVWLAVGVLVFVVSTGAALLDAPSQVVWSVLLALAALAGRFVPLLAVDVPDQFLLDLERLAVTAWSARERPAGRRGRVVVPRAAVAAVATGGARLLTAASGAVLVVCVVAAPLLLTASDVEIDLIGARVQVGFCGAALLLAARSYRHAGARVMLRAAGLSCWGFLAVDLFDVLGATFVTVVTVASMVLGVLVVLVAVALGRGWRSAWWSRRAEVAEALAGSVALASVVVAAGLFGRLWTR